LNAVATYRRACFACAAAMAPRHSWSCYAFVLPTPVMSLTKVVAKNLRSLRTRRKLSQESVAAKARLSVSYISMLERAQRSPALETLEALAKALKVSPLDLLRG